MRELMVSIFILSSVWIRAAEAAAAECREAKAPGEMVALLHGRGRTSVSMKGLEWYLARRGYRVVNITYPSLSHSIEELADQHLDRELKEEIGDRSAAVHFVTHSLGGIVLRQYLSNHSLTNLGRVVMLAPPNQGSELADWLKQRAWGQRLLGQSGRQLGTAATDLPKRLGPVRFDLGVIAGDRSWNPWFSWIIPGPDDGKVGVENTKVEGLKDFLVVHSSHTWMMWRRSTLHQVEHFLAQGRFDRKDGVD